jgi:BlaI family penicillinase repressor
MSAKPLRRVSAKRVPLPQISDAEWVVLNVVMERAPITANQVVADLATRTAWKPRTIQTLLRRLVSKGALVFEKQGREHVFRPSVDGGKLRFEASRSFLERLFDGRMAPFLACFLDQEKLSPEEIEELRALLKRKLP